jgi:hypothetical protein
MHFIHALLNFLGSPPGIVSIVGGIIRDAFVIALGGAIAFHPGQIRELLARSVYNRFPFAGRRMIAFIDLPIANEALSGTTFLYVGKRSLPNIDPKPQQHLYDLAALAQPRLGYERIRFVVNPTRRLWLRRSYLLAALATLTLVPGVPKAPANVTDAKGMADLHCYTNCDPWLLRTCQDGTWGRDTAAPTT